MPKYAVVTTREYEKEGKWYDHTRIVESDNEITAIDLVLEQVSLLPCWKIVKVWAVNYSAVMEWEVTPATPRPEWKRGKLFCCYGVGSNTYNT